MAQINLYIKAKCMAHWLFQVVPLGIQTVQYNQCSAYIQEPGWTWYIGHPIESIMRKTILDHF